MSKNENNPKELKLSRTEKAIREQKNLIIENKEAFEHWLNGGNVSFKTDIWFDVDGTLKDNPFCLDRTDKVKIVVINDEVVEERKKLAERKLYLKSKMLDDAIKELNDTTARSK